MGIQIVSLFHTCAQCGETEDPSVGLYLRLEKGICEECRETPDEEKEDYLSLEDLLMICGHSALGLSIRDALEINPHYRHEIERPL